MLPLGAVQAQVPPGGYALKKVKQLTIAPEPPGGLIPYRKGRLWGYADTTGQIWIKPVFAQEPAPFARGVGLLGINPARNQQALINARGELLRVSFWWNAIGFAPNGGFRRIRRRGVGFRPEFTNLHYPPGRREAVFDTLWLSPRNNDDDRLSPTRGDRAKNGHLPGKFLALNPEYQQVAMTNEHGRRLTAYAYSEIGPFRGGFAWARRTGSAGFVLLNRQGREVIQPRSHLEPITNNRTLAASRQDRSRTELLDSTGRVIRSFFFNSDKFPQVPSHQGRDSIQRANRLWPPYYTSTRWLIEGEVLVAPTQSDRVALYDRDGQPLLNGQEFAAVAEFWNNRLWVRTLDRQEGLLDRRLRWAVPAVYDELYYPRRDGSRQHELLRRQDLQSFYYDTAYMVARQQRRVGQVAIRDGHLMVPIRYDSILVLFRNGFATVQRAGEPYVVNGEGREVTPGWAASEYAERRDGLWQVGVRRGQQGALFDEIGQQLCPWWESLPETGGHGFFLPRPGYDDLTIVYANRPDSLPPSYGSPLANLINRAGQLQLPWRYTAIRTGAGVYALRFQHGADGWEVMDRQLRPLLSQPVRGVQLLPGGWLCAEREMFHTSGRRLAVPSAATQHSVNTTILHLQKPHPLVTATQHFVGNTRFLPDEPFAKGVWRVEWDEPNQRFNQYAGYLTIHGRPLWED